MQLPEYEGYINQKDGICSRYCSVLPRFLRIKILIHKNKLYEPYKNDIWIFMIQQVIR